MGHDLFHQGVFHLTMATMGIVWRNSSRQTEQALESMRLKSLQRLSDPDVALWVTWLDAQDSWTASELNRVVLHNVASAIFRHSVDRVTEQRKMQLAWRDIESEIENIEADELDNWFVQQVLTQPGRVHGGIGDYEEQVALITHRARIVFNKIVGKLHESGNPF